MWGLNNSVKYVVTNRKTEKEHSNFLHQHACQSEGNALYFHGGEGAGHSFASTRDIDLHREEGRSYWEEDFESPPSK